MKNIIFSTLCICVFNLMGKGQDAGFYIKGGLNIANISTSTDGRINKANSLPGFHIGIMGDLPVGKFFAVQPGLLLTGKGAKTQTGQPGDVFYYKASSNPYYLELPVNFVLKMPLANESYFFVGAGPYAAMAIAGKNKVDGNAGLIAFSGNSNIKFSNDSPGSQQDAAGLGIMQRFDFGVNATAGLQLQMILLSVNYGYGITKINTVEQNSNDKNKNRVFSVSVGVRL